jgi:hypothetical protein
MLAVAAFTSCLGEGGDKVSLGNYPGVAMMRGDSTFVYVKGGDLLFAKSGLSSVMDGECVIIDFTLDRGLKENADSGKVRGFYTVDVKRLATVPQSALKVNLTDTAKVLSGERTLSAVYDFNAFVRDKFFLFTSHRQDSLPLIFEMSCDMPNAVRGNVYDLFLRIYPKEGGEKATQPVTLTNAFDLGELSRSETDSLFFRINFPRQFNSDSSVISWASTPVYRIGLNSGK